ncbi:MAG: hypothetical protein H0W85_07975 [Methylotenera sp.]|nr:hypothetical protein [Methylotenera sp.]
MKSGFIAFSFLVMLSGNSYAFECNTVMGGCPTDTNAGATSAHMRSEIAIRSPRNNNLLLPTSATKTTVSPSNTANKKSQGSRLIQTINKNVLK